MASIGKLAKSFFMLLLPIGVLLLLAFGGASFLLLKESAKPPAAAYLVTPERYLGLSTRGAKITEENWGNADGSGARGWLLRGKEGGPAVVLLHRYGADRSHVLNLGVKMNEVTNFTILMPDLRGHGLEAPVKTTSFGGCEKDDLASAIQYLRGLKTESGAALAGNEIGLFGIELGAYSALAAASGDPSVKALLLDSVPADSNALLATVVQKRYPFASFATSKIAQAGTYFLPGGCYTSESACNIAGKVSNRKVMLLGGIDVPSFQESTRELGKCFPSPAEVNADLSISGFSVLNASAEQAEAYDQRVIEFFRRSLVAN